MAAPSPAFCAPIPTENMFSYIICGGVYFIYLYSFLATMWISGLRLQEPMSIHVMHNAYIVLKSFRDVHGQSPARIASWLLDFVFGIGSAIKEPCFMEGR